MAEIPSHPVFGSTTGWNGMRKKPGSASATTSKVTVRIVEFDEETCECNVSGDIEIWENDSSVNANAGDLTLSVDDWISGLDSSDETKCAKVTAVNSTGTAVGSTDTEYANCAACNAGESLCGGSPGGP